MSSVALRAMLSGSYKPRWLDVLDEEGTCFGSAIVFTIDRCHQHAGHLALDAREAAVVEVREQMVV